MISDPMMGIIMLALFIGLLMLGFPIAFTLMAMGVGFGYYAMGDVFVSAGVETVSRCRV